MSEPEGMSSSRSYEPITSDDLERLRQIATNNRKEFFEREPICVALSNRVLCVALCQGAALHYIDGKNGVKDFDVWTFYAELPDAKFPPRWRVEKDFSDAKFGQSPDKPHFVGRRVDLLGRSLPVGLDSNPIDVLQAYLSSEKTTSARELAKKAVVLLEPEELLGTVVWPIESASK